MEAFPSVPGQHSAEWRSRLALIQSYALGVCTGQEGGLIGFISDAPTYLLDYEHPFIPYPHPGPSPAANAGAEHGRLTTTPLHFDNVSHLQFSTSWK